MLLANWKNVQRLLFIGGDDFTYSFKKFFMEFALPIALLVKYVETIEPDLERALNMYAVKSTYQRLRSMTSMYKKFLKMKL